MKEIGIIDLIEMVTAIVMVFLTLALVLYTKYLATTSVASQKDAKTSRIVAWIEPSLDDPSEFYFVLSNYSSNPAYNVGVKSPDEIFILESKDPKEAKIGLAELFKSRIAVIPPKYNHKIVLGVIPGPGSSLSPINFERSVVMNISWDDEDGESHEKAQSVDWRLIPTVTLGDTKKKIARKTAENLVNMNKNIKVIALGISKISTDLHKSVVQNEIGKNDKV